ncbi:MAG TPA: hypothetical protein VIH59_00210 [Candidatus Tectomicrobia bacterium]
MENTVTTAKKRRKVSWQRFVLVAGCMLLAALVVWMIVAPSPHGGAGQVALARSQVTFEEATGVRLRWIAMTAGGGMIDLRYQVLDPDKALIVHDKERPPRIIDEATGRILSRPWMAHAHKRGQRTAVTYNQLLMNSGGILKRGSQVTVVIGDARLEHVVVQ